MTSRRMILFLYRCILRTAQEMTRSNETFLIRKPMDKTAARRGFHAFYRPESPGVGYRLQASQILLGIDSVKDLDLPASGSLDGATLHRIVRHFFKQNKTAAPQDSAALVDQAFASLRGISDQRQMQNCSSTAVSRGILVDATSVYLEQQEVSIMGWALPRYNFAYRIYIENTGNECVALQSRYWHIRESNGSVQEVQRGSPGVLGKYPLLKPGDAFEYYSSVSLNSSQAEMHGSFQMEVLENVDQRVDVFDARVGAFKLTAPPGEAGT